MAELPPFKNPLKNPSPQADQPLQPAASPVGETLAPTESVRVESPRPSRWQGLASLSAWMLRWALLGIGVGSVWGLGIVVAQFFPAANPAPPLQEKVLRRIHRFVRKVRSFPSWWAGDVRQGERSALLPPPQPAVNAPPVDVPPVALSDEAREQVTVELAAVRAGLQQLRDRTSALETQLGLPALDKPLEERLSSVTNRLSPPAELPPATASEPAQPAAPPRPISEPLFRVDAYRVTLPGDVMFTPGETFLQTAAQPLLDTILLDIGRYPGATVLVGSYTDLELEAATPAEVSHQQAIAVQNYLSQRLGDESYHWVTVGYGNSFIGITGGSLLNRRVVIAIVP